jgi:hypothetical protein
VKLTVIAVAALAIVALLAALVYQNYRRFHRPLLTTPYQAVTLSNGDTYYGHLDHLGTDHPVLRDAFSIRHEMGPATKEPRYVLVRHREQARGADHMILAAGAILYVEPVRPDSTIGKLIAENESRH